MNTARAISLVFGVKLMLRIAVCLDSFSTVLIA